MTVTSAPIGNSAQSLDGFAVNANVPAAFRESVVITDPSDPLGAVAVVSSQPISFYGIPVWIQGTPNFSSTVNITSTINVTSVLSGQISSFAINSIPGTTMVNVVSTVPQTLNISQVSTFAINTASTQIVSSIPFFVSQSSSPWVVSSAPIALVGTSMVNIVSSIPLGGGTQYLDGAATTAATGNVAMWAGGTSSGTVQAVSTSHPLPVSASGTVSTFATGNTSTFVVNAPNVNVTNVPSVNLTSSIPLLVAQSTTPWIVNVSNTQYLSGATTSGPTGTINMFASGTSSQTMQAVNSSAGLPVNIVSTVTLGANITSSIPFFVAQSSAPWAVNGTTTPNIVSSIPLLVTQSATSNPWTVNGQINVSSFTAVASVAAIPVTQGGLQAAFKIGLTTSAITIKGSAGKIHDLWFTNTGTSTRWLKLYNASSVAVGTTAPLMVFGMPGTTTGANAIAGWISSAMGIQFSTSIFAACTASSATSTDTSAPASGDIILNVGYI